MKPHANAMCKRVSSINKLHRRFKYFLQLCVSHTSVFTIIDNVVYLINLFCFLAMPSYCNICAIVVGLPVNMDGTNSEQTKIVVNFVNKLAKKTNLPIYLQDERLTSKAADSLLRNMGFNRKQRNERDDMAAASMILETTLESARRL